MKQKKTWLRKENFNGTQKKRNKKKKKKQKKKEQKCVKIKKKNEIFVSNTLIYNMFSTHMRLRKKKTPKKTQQKQYYFATRLILLTFS